MSSTDCLSHLDIEFRRESCVGADALARHACQFRHAAGRRAFPEGITANTATGDIYVATFDTIGPNPNKLLRYSRHGQLVGSRTIESMLGLAFGPSDSRCTSPTSTNRRSSV